MKVTGVAIMFVDMPREAEADFNRWYDTDHMPEACSAAGAIVGRRYHAEDAIMPYRHSLEGAPPIGHARYCSLYLLGDPDLEATRARMGEIGKRLVAAKRGFPKGKVVFNATYRLIHAYGAPRIKLSTEALPYIGHRGLQVAMGYVPDPKDVPEATEWWHSSHYPDMLSVPGWAAALKCEPLGEEGKGRFMHLFLQDKPAKEAHEELEKRLPEWRAAGRSPHPRGIYKRVFSGPFSQFMPGGYESLG